MHVSHLTTWITNLILKEDCASCLHTSSFQTMGAPQPPSTKLMWAEQLLKVLSGDETI